MFLSEKQICLSLKRERSLSSGSGTMLGSGTMFMADPHASADETPACGTGTVVSWGGDVTHASRVQ